MMCATLNSRNIHSVAFIYTLPCLQCNKVTSTLRGFLLKVYKKKKKHSFIINSTKTNEK